jgi:hypothetical protein
MIFLQIENSYLIESTCRLNYRYKLVNDVREIIPVYFADRMKPTYIFCVQNSALEDYEGGACSNHWV